MASIEITIKRSISYNFYGHSNTIVHSCYTFIINITILKHLNVLCILEEHQEGVKLVFVINTNFTSLYIYIELYHHQYSHTLNFQYEELPRAIVIIGLWIQHMWYGSLMESASERLSVQCWCISTSWISCFIVREHILTILRNLSITHIEFSNSNTKPKTDL